MFMRLATCGLVACALTASIQAVAQSASDVVPHPVARSYDISGASIVPSKKLGLVDENSGQTASLYAPAMLTALVMRQGDRTVKFDRFDDFIMVQPMPDWVREAGLDSSVLVPPVANGSYRFEILPPGSTSSEAPDRAGFAAWAADPDLPEEAATSAAAVDRALVSYSTACAADQVHVEGSAIASGLFRFGLFACGQLNDSPEELAGQMALVVATMIEGREFLWYREWRGEAFAVEDHKTAGPVSSAEFQAEFEHYITWVSVHGPVPAQDFAAAVLVAEQIMAAQAEK